VLGVDVLKGTENGRGAGWVVWGKVSRGTGRDWGESGYWLSGVFGDWALVGVVRGVEGGSIGVKLDSGCRFGC